MAHALAALPAVHEVLCNSAFRAASVGLADRYRVRLVRYVIQEERDRVSSGCTPPGGEGPLAEIVLRACIREAEAVLRPAPGRVINGTGVLIHTNLGRAPLGELVAGLEADLAGYTDLEWDAGSQQRGDRDLPLQRQLRLLTGAEGALVVNNCASALFLALGTLAAGKEVLVSRSELVEIGGSFRVPAIMEASGCVLREVGTTNKTRLSDFEQHARPGNSVLLKVHQSNFVQRGFVERVSTEELVALGRRLGIPVIEDNGSGLLTGPDMPALPDEPRMTASLGAGVDVVCSSADKLLGSIQAGLLLGRREWIAAMRGNPLYRVLRLDKVRMALLDRTLKYYLAGRDAQVPLWRLFHANLSELEARIAGMNLPGPETRWVRCRPVPLQARLGGGTNPERSFASVGLELEHRDHSSDELKRRFALRTTPIVGYVRKDRYYVDVLAFVDGDFAELQAALNELSGPPVRG